MICFHGIDALEPRLQAGEYEDDLDMIVVACSVCGVLHGQAVPLVDLFRAAASAPLVVRDDEDGESDELEKT